MESNPNFPYQERPILVFWETTRACLLSCHHCRASAQPDPLPGQLTTHQAKMMMNQIANFGDPLPVVVFTGGDPLMRKDLIPMLNYAKSLGIKTAVSPAVTSLITDDALKDLKASGVRSISLSIDGASSETHDEVRGVKGTFERSERILQSAQKIGLNVQVNTTVMRRNMTELADILHFMKAKGIETWEVIFLVKTGRAQKREDLTQEENEAVCNFLYDATSYLKAIRCIEAPMIRRLARQRKGQHVTSSNPLYDHLINRLVKVEGTSDKPASVRTFGTLDGDGIIFVGHDGEIFPGGFVPVSLGNIAEDSLVQVYRDDHLLERIRRRDLKGRCGVCLYRYNCGGSRARAYAYSQDPLAEDPACLYSVT